MHTTLSTLRQLTDQGAIPSISMCVRVDGHERLHHTAGIARLPDHPVAPDQAYDLASLTKVLATVPVTAALIASGRLDLDAPVKSFIPDIDARITARHLLSHGSGYPAWAALYERTDAWGSERARNNILRMARQTPLQAEPGSAHTYSDLGYLVLCELLEILGGGRLDTLLPARAGIRWGWPDAAATENCPVRKRILQGEVHDLNCFAMGGVSSHAGLFGTARAVALAGERFLDPSEAERTLISGGGPGSHRLGFDSISAGYTSTGSHFPPDTIGHLGYTGTSLWIAPSRRTVVVVLTNRIHPTDDLTAIKVARPLLHDAVAADLGWHKAQP